MSDTVILAIIAAVGAVATACVAMIPMLLATLKAARVAAAEAKNAIEEEVGKLRVNLTQLRIVVDETGARVDGRLSELLAAEIGKARAEGVANGVVLEKMQQKDRDAAKISAMEREFERGTVEEQRRAMASTDDFERGVQQEKTKHQAIEGVNKEDIEGST